MTPEISEFAEVLVRQVRDAAVRSCDMQLEPETETPVAKRWKTSIASVGGASNAAMLVPDCIDEAVFHLLRAIDQGLLVLSYTASNGRAVDLSVEGRGELSGWYMATGGWRSLYAAERFVDDFADLGDPPV